MGGNFAARQNHRLSQRLRFAKLPQSACVEGLDLRTPRNIDTNTLTHLMSKTFIREHLNALIYGLIGVGNTQQIEQGLN